MSSRSFDQKLFKPYKCGKNILPRTWFLRQFKTISYWLRRFYPSLFCILIDQVSHTSYGTVYECEHPNGRNWLSSNLFSYQIAIKRWKKSRDSIIRNIFHYLQCVLYTRSLICVTYHICIDLNLNRNWSILLCKNRGDNTTPTERDTYKYTDMEESQKALLTQRKIIFFHSFNSI